MALLQLTTRRRLQHAPDGPASCRPLRKRKLPIQNSNEIAFVPSTEICHFAVLITSHKHAKLVSFQDHVQRIGKAATLITLVV